MDLRPPPPAPETRSAGRLSGRLLLINLLAIVALGALVWWRTGAPGGAEADPERLREVASKLKAAGALDESAERFERYLAISDDPPEARAKVAFSVGSTYLEQGAYEKALRWFYEAEALGGGALDDELAQKIVHSLERLGRHHAAKAALDARTQLPTDATQRPEADPVVALIGEEEIRRSAVERLLDGLPPQAVATFADPAQKAELLKKYVADELLWRKAVKLEYDRDDEVRNRHSTALKELAVSKLVEVEIFAKVTVDEVDLRSFFEANRDRYRERGQGDEPGRQLSLDEARQAVDRDYRLSKTQSAYQRMIESELSTEKVEMFPERMTDG